MKSKSNNYVLSLVFLMLFTGGLLGSAYHYSNAQSAATSDLSRLSITFPAQSVEIITYFNSLARPDDIVSIPEAFAQALSQINAGQIMLVFTSWEEAEKVIPDYSSQIAWVLYNPEHWENTPISEQQNLPATVQKAAEFLHAYNLRLFLAPDRLFVDESLEDLAPHTDALLLQGQRLQDDPQAFALWMTEKIDIARAVHPNLLIYAQVGANRGTPEQMLSAIQTVADQIDGIAIWSVPRTLDILKDFIALLRPSFTASSTPTDMASETLLPPTTVLETSQTTVPHTTIPEPTTSKPGLAPKITSPAAPGGETEMVEPSPSAIIATPQPGADWLPNEDVILIFLCTISIFLGIITAVLFIIFRKKRYN